MNTTKPLFTNGQLVQVQTKDGIALHGFLNGPDKKTKKLFLLTHGAISNFYISTKNCYLENVALNKGYAFLTVNNRGRDYYARRELIADCLLDFDAWINFILKRRYTEIIFCGSSLATHKIVYYITRKKIANIKKLILIAPSDNIGLWKKHVQEKAQYWLDYAKNLIEEGKEDQLMPREAYPRRLHARTYYDRYRKDSLLHTWDFHDQKFDPSISFRIKSEQGQKLDFGLVKRVKLPTLIVTGDKDEYIEDHYENMRRLEEMNDCIKTKVVKGAPHSFEGYEKELANIVRKFVS